MKKDVLQSEQKATMTAEEWETLMSSVEAMTEEELASFRSKIDPDKMGFLGREGIGDES